MHIIIGLITAIAGLIWALTALQRSGLDITAINPAAWSRRRRWRKLHGTKPIFSLQRPMEAAALLLVGMVKQDGEITREQKMAVIDAFVREFHLGEAQAREVFGSSAFLLKDEINLDQSVSGILAPSREAFTPEQTESLLALLDEVARLEGEPSEAQRRLLEAVRRELGSASAASGKWS